MGIITLGHDLSTKSGNQLTKLIDDNFNTIVSVINGNLDINNVTDSSHLHGLVPDYGATANTIPVRLANGALKVARGGAADEALRLDQVQVNPLVNLGWLKVSVTGAAFMLQWGKRDVSTAGDTYETINFSPAFVAIYGAQVTGIGSTGSPAVIFGVFDLTTANMKVSWNNKDPGGTGYYWLAYGTIAGV